MQTPEITEAAASEPRFIFRGNAMPFGGRITKRRNEAFYATIPSPPTAALAVTGGLSSARGGELKPHDAFRWGETFAEAKGEQVSRTRYKTTVTSSVSRMFARNDPHIFEADILRVTMVSDHAYGKPASIQIPEVAFKGLRLDKDPIEVEYHTDLNDCPTMDSFQDRYQSNREFFDRHQSSLIPNVRFGDPIPRTAGGYALTSIVYLVRWRRKVYRGNTLTVPDFGTIYFGEVLMNESNRRLTMVRMRMGSDLGADIACAEADPNGVWGE
jgi:hypothetical protein